MHTHAYLIGSKENEMERKDIIFDIETLTLDPLEEGARVVAIGLRCGDFHKVFTANKEKDLLTEFWNLPFFNGSFKLIGFNSSQFDLPYLIVRSFKYGIKIPQIQGRSIDLRFVLSYGNKFQNGKLSQYASLFLKEETQKLSDGNSVKEWWEQNEIEFIELYCGRDVFITFKIFERLKNMGVIDG
ncbi:ribonuclease H-like domain-containing protein [Candidatus Woesearchaeota archaeon]|nr:ribonuclease H-like domain-containing protein [Candidatus Woesearchaeota archaeon]